jgi:hypothetical protein
MFRDTSTNADHPGDSSALAMAARDVLEDAFLDTARWRREKATEYPNDERNLEAAALLDRLATTVDQVEPELLAAYAKLHDDYCDIETHSEMLRAIGFDSAPETASEFVAKFISKAGRKACHEA